MNWSRLRSSGNDHVFKGSQLVSNTLERHPQQFRSRAAALKFCRQLFNDGIIRGVFGADTFEDSVQLYSWKKENGPAMTSQTTSIPKRGYGYSGADIKLTKRDLYRQRDSIRKLDDSKSELPNNMSKSTELNSYYKDICSDLEEDRHAASKHVTTYNATWNLQRASTASSESSVDILSHSYSKHKDKHSVKSAFNTPSTVAQQSRDHGAIPEEAQEDHVMERTGTSTEYDGSSSIPRSVATDVSAFNDVDGLTSQRRWQDYQNSFSDNEKQLIEQMKRMKKEHSHILRTYEDRINKLMAKMHELRSIAEMLENSSTKSSPYGMIANRSGIMNFLASTKADSDRKSNGYCGDGEQPPPLPPRPGRGSRLNPNKPVIQTEAKMKTLQWCRVILKDEGDDCQPTIWHTMMEPKIDPEEIERLFSMPEVSQTDGATLYDDLIIRRGRSRQQLVSIYDSERSKRIVVCMKCLRATLNDVIATVSSLDTSQVNHDALVELLELLSSMSEIEKILYHVRKKGAGHLDHPEYLVFELSKVDHFKDRLEFIRFRFKMQWHLFEIDQQMRELHTACDEITNSTPLKNLLETLLSVGNYLNGATEMGQADGYALDVLNKLKETQDRDGKGTLLEFVLKTYCQAYESEVDIGCPTRFRLPEPSNMRHAAQVSFEGIQDALSNLHADLRHVREKLLDPKVNKDTTRPMDSFRVIAENFFAAALEVIGEQEKLLQDTRDVFDRTVRYFLIDLPHGTTPQQFFHTWAVFLHDCKYFWKLAHRKLARERFELEFKYKGQMSACSLNGYGSFRAGVLDGMNSACTTDPKTSTGQRRLNKWMESLGSDTTKPNIPPKPARTADSRRVDDVPGVPQRSASPKPLTSSPPISASVHKPLPKAPIVTPALSPIGTQYPPPNYENQSELDRMTSRPPATSLSQSTRTHTVQSPQSSDVVDINHTPRSALYISPESRNQSSKDKKSSQQFSLKAWLKREREQVRREVESDDGSPNQQKSQPSSKPFARFKNSMMQKFSGGSSSKKQDPKPEIEKSYVGKTENPITISPPVGNFSPYGIMGNKPACNENLEESQMHLTNTNFDQHDGDFNSYGSEAVISPIDDPDNEETSLKTTSPYGGHVTYGVVKPEMRQTDEKMQQNSDMNNNDKYRSPESSGADRASRQLHFPENGYPAPPSDQAVMHPVAASKCVKAQAVPVYKAKIINNYENQGKFESPNALRQQAEPVIKDQGQDGANLNGSSRRESNQYSRQGLQNDYNRRDTTSNYQRHGNRSQYNDYSANISPYKYASRYGHKSDHQKTEDKSDDRKQHVPIPSSSAASNAKPVSSLIDRFNNNVQSNINHDSATPLRGMKPVSANYGQGINEQYLTHTVNSTPVSLAKKEAANSDISEVSPPLPPRSSPSKPERLSSPNTRPVHGGGGRMTQGDQSSYMSPYARLDNLTMSTSTTPALNSTPSFYSTPQSNFNTPQSNFHSPQSIYNTPQSNYNSPQSNNNTPDEHNSQLPAKYTTPRSSRSHYNNNHVTSSSREISQSKYFNNQNHGQSRDNYNDQDQNLPPRLYDRNLPNGNVGYSPVSREDPQDDRDDGYRAMLRRAANNSTFDRYGKLGHYSGRPSFGSGQNTSSHVVSPEQTRSPGSTGLGNTAVVKPSVHGDSEVSYMAF